MLGAIVSVRGHRLFFMGYLMLEASVELPTQANHVTTHSSDCWQSLADIAEQSEINGDGIRIHRIEKGARHSIVFDERKIIIAANREIEVR
jgi:hypothetical protein